MVEEDGPPIGAFACYSCVPLTAAVILVSIGLVRKSDDDSINEYRQELLKNMTKECYAADVINQTSCSYSCNCEEVCSGTDSDIICHQVCDTCDGMQINYTGRTDKCGNEATFHFQDACSSQQRYWHYDYYPFECFIENCTSTSMSEYVYPINLPDEQHGGIHKIRDGCICGGVSIFCLIVFLFFVWIWYMADQDSTNP